MRTQSLLTLLATAAAVKAQTQPAPIITNNPIGAQYVATLPDKASTTLRGAVQIQSSPDGKGVEVSVAVAGLPAEGGPFMYHIHEKPVPADGNCTGTGAHLDPYKRGEVPICDATKFDSCQTGDLSGKHDNITSRSFSAQYTDLYLATNPSDPSYIGNLSVVFHLSNKTRISCANFTLKAGGVPKPTSSGTTLPSGTGTGTFPTTILNNTLSSTATATGNSSASYSATNTVNPPTASPTTSTLPSSPAQKLAVGAGAMAMAAVALFI